MGTGRLTDDGACAEGEPGEAVMDPAHCMSGEVGPDNTCLCVSAGSSHEKAEACCSGMHEDGTDVCACMPSEFNLHHGAKPSDCCSELALGGVCECQVPGGPIKPGRGLDGCCAHNAVEYGDRAHCGCAGLSDSVTADNNGYCCGGLYNGAERKCSCIPPGFLVAGFVKKDSCCSGELERDQDGARCKGHPEPQPALPEPVEPTTPPEPPPALPQQDIRCGLSQHSGNTGEGHTRSRTREHTNNNVIHLARSHAPRFIL